MLRAMQTYNTGKGDSDEGGLLIQGGGEGLYNRTQT